MFLEAEFIGQDKRLVRFNSYKIIINENIAHICIDDITGFDCPYQSLEAFFKNWNHIKITFYS